MAKLDPRVEEARERRKREDQAPRLLGEVPNLLSLRLEFVEHRGERQLAAHAEPVALAHAAAFLEVPCGDESCRHGGYELTGAMMRALLAGTTHFEGRDECRGDTGSAPCARVLHYSGAATYRDD